MYLLVVKRHFSKQLITNFPRKIRDVEVTYRASTKLFVKQADA